MSSDQQAMVTLELAGEVVTEMVKANSRQILAGKRFGKQRQQDSRNVLMESTLNHWELVSFLAVAVDRLAVYEALTPSQSKEQGLQAFLQEVKRQGISAETLDQIGLNLPKLVEAVLTR